MDIESKVKSLKAIWGKRLITECGQKWKAVPALLYKTNDISLFFKMNQEVKAIHHKFYQEIFSAWSDVRVLDEHLNNMNIRSQILWNNRYLKISKKPFYWRQWADNDIFMIQDIITEDGKFMNEADLRKKYSINCSFLDFLQVRDSIPKVWKIICT